MATVSASPRRQFKLSKFVLSWYGIIIIYSLMFLLFFLLRQGDGNNPVALRLGGNADGTGGLTFRWYGVIITIGVIVAAFLAQFLAERRGDDPDHIWRILPVLLVSAILAARLWYVVNTWENYKDHIFSFGGPKAGAFEIWRGGIAIQGAVVGGIIGALLYGWFWNRGRKGQRLPFSFWRFADFVAPGLVLAQGIGRWGNFMNNEAYGRETKLPWGIKIPCDYRTNGSTPGTVDTGCPSGGIVNGAASGNNGISKDALFHPTFFYESVWNYFTFIILFFFIMRPKTVEKRFKLKLRDGDIFLLYWVIYSIGRFFTEGLRTDSLYLIGNPNNGGIRSAQALAIAGILIGGFLLFYRHRKSFSITEALSMRLAPVLAPATGTMTVIGDSVEGQEAPVLTSSAEDLDASEVTSVDAEPEILDDEDRAKPDYKARVRPVAPTESEVETALDSEGALEEAAESTELTATASAADASASEPVALKSPEAAVAEASVEEVKRTSQDEQETNKK